MTPRPFQSRALESLRANVREGKRAVVLVSPTGSGKTCMGAVVAASHVARGGRVAWLAHRTELVDQAVRTLEGFGLLVGARGRNATAPVQVCMRQTIAARGQAPDATLVVSDECHHDGDHVGWSDTVRAYRAAGAVVIGLTATPERGDGAALEGYEAIVTAAQIRELQELGLLVPLRIRAPSRALGSKYIAQRPVDAYLEAARGRSAVVFAPHLVAAEEYVRDFKALGVPAKLVSGETPEEERSATLRLFATGALPVVVNVQVLTEGFDAPRCSCVIVARGCGSQGLWIQMVGRGLRPAQGKRDCVLLDLRGLTHVHGRPDADREYSLDGEGIRLAGGNPVQERLCKVCGAPLGDSLTCLECGKEHEQVTPKATGEPLSDWEEAWGAAKAVLNPGRIVLALAGIIKKSNDAAAAGKPWKDGAVTARFRAIFHRQPFPQEVVSANNLLRTAHNYEPVQRKLGT